VRSTDLDPHALSTPAVQWLEENACCRTFTEQILHLLPQCVRTEHWLSCLLEHLRRRLDEGSTNGVFEGANHSGSHARPETVGAAEKRA